MSLKIKKPWLKINFLFKFSEIHKEAMRQRHYIFEFVEKLVEDHEKEFPRHESAAPKPYLDHLYKIRDTMDYDEHIVGLGMFLIASFDTTGRAISNTLLFLAMNQQVQEKLAQEVMSVISCDDDDLDEEKLAKMVYLDMVIKESLRLIPAGLFMGRLATDDITLGKL